MVFNAEVAKAAEFTEKALQKIFAYFASLAFFAFEVLIEPCVSKSS